MLQKLSQRAWIDQPFAFLRRRSRRYWPTHWGPPRWRLPGARRPRPAPPSPWRRTLREPWRQLVWLFGSLFRGRTVKFTIGHSFWMSGRTWVCTDVGTRTICAVLLEDLRWHGDSGPPYAVAEHVLDRYDFEACSAEPPAEES